MRTLTTAALLVLLATCSDGGRSGHVRFDMSALRRAALDSGTTLSAVRMLVDGPGMERISADIDVDALTFDLEVPAGLGRHFELRVRGEMVESASNIPLYWGEQTLDLEAGADVDLEIFAFRAGTIAGRVKVQYGVTPPSDFAVKLSRSELGEPRGFAGITSPTSPSTEYKVTLDSDGFFEAWVPQGFYYLMASFAQGGVTYEEQNISTSRTLYQGDEENFGLVLLEEPGCVDSDRDSFCTSDDCDDAASSCNLAATCDADGDNDFTPDCRDLCLDGDDDQHGEAHERAIPGPGFIAVEDCTDGYYSCNAEPELCLGPDCDDATPFCAADCSVHDNDNDGLEVCEGDCDDDAATGAGCQLTGCTIWYPDADGDGYATYDGSRPFCANPASGWLTFVDSVDCDDSRSSCDFDCMDADQDGLAPCQGDLDDQNPHCDTSLTDADTDGVCANHDCDDSDFRVFRTASCASCADSDSDGLFEGCDRYSVGQVFTPHDCNDNSGAAYDADGDGVPACATPRFPTPDCDDGNPLVRPGRYEDCNDGVDNDCNGSADNEEFDCFINSDGDSDGYPDYRDCVSDNPSSFPSDDDNDGFDPCWGSGDSRYDCDDTNERINPHAQENCTDVGVVDEDCNGYANTTVSLEDSMCLSGSDLDGDGLMWADCDDSDSHANFVDADGDGYYSCPDPYNNYDTDCDDFEPGANPSVSEVCDDAIDNDCDGMVDGNDYDCGGSGNPRS
jgi:hypothetical protein